MIDIIPAILTSDIGEVEEKVRAVEGLRLKNGRDLRRIHIDIIDSNFAPSRTVNPTALSGIETDVLYDIHLMVNNPVAWIQRAANAMSDRIIAQIEMMPSQEEFVLKGQELGAKIGLALDLNTPVSALDPLVRRDLDAILVLGVKAGRSGQRFHYSVLDKIKQLCELRTSDSAEFRIIVDGGVSTETIGKIVESGADEVVAASAVFSGDPEQNINELLKAAYKRDQK